MNLGNLAILVLAAVLLGVLSLAPKEEIPGASFEIVGKEAPDFRLRDLNGDIWRLGDHLGNPVVISFWTTWCGACKQDLAILEEFHRKYGAKFVVVGVCPEHWKRVPEVLREHPVSFPILHDPGELVTRRYELLGERTRYPFTVFVDRSGKVRCVWAYAFRDLEQMLEVMARCGLRPGAQSPR